MENRNLGRTGVKVSQFCLGAMMFGRQTNEADSVAIIQHALDAGINFIDTANAYSAGASEKFVGKALANFALLLACSTPRAAINHTAVALRTKVG